jgi:hypothetical protein
VVDVVCLVSDFPSFLAAISTWDRDHYFPVLFDDTEYSFKFLRAFRPARVIRFPKRPEAVAAEQVWEEAVLAVGRSWATSPKDQAPRGDARPPLREPGPPAVVLSAPESPLLASAVALAAGRFQPLLRWETNKHTSDMLSPGEANALSLQVEETVSKVFPEYRRIADDCDFVTLAGDYPYAYSTPIPAQNGPFSLDDRIGFASRAPERWAYTGRLIGSTAASLYRAMCSLFLQPSSALLFDGYDPQTKDFRGYGMQAAKQRLAPLLAVSDRAGLEQAGVDGWRRVFEGGNRFGLVMINTRGSSGNFTLRDGDCKTDDIPDSVPSIIVQIHSHSAAEPGNGQTLAGRWLDNGAYLYAGAMFEPYLGAFRTPGVVADLLAQGLPFAAAVRQSPKETFGFPWRMVCLGDPLYRLKPARQRPNRENWSLISNWPAYAQPKRPAAALSDDARLAWAVPSAIVLATRGGDRDSLQEIITQTRLIERGRLSGGNRPIFDGLIVDLLLQAGRDGELRERLRHVPAAERNPALEGRIRAPRAQVGRLRAVNP